MALIIEILSLIIVRIWRVLTECFVFIIINKNSFISFFEGGLCRALSKNLSIKASSSANDVNGAAVLSWLWRRVRRRCLSAACFDRRDFIPIIRILF